MYSAPEQKTLIELTHSLLRSRLIDFEPEKTIAALRKVLRYHDWRYYVLSDAVITDHEYDNLFSRLRELEAAHPEWITPDSPTQRVALGKTDEFAEVPHLAAMLSLENSYNEADLNDFDRRVKQLTGSPAVHYCIEPKFDGASIALVYENDQLIRAATRGDGTVGEDITNNAKAISSIPLHAPFSKYGIHRIEIRGEVIIDRHVFSKMNEERKQKGEKLFQNARNTASGSLRLKDAAEVAQRRLEAILYHISYAENQNGQNLLGMQLPAHSSNIELLYECGFKTPLREMQVCSNMDEVHRHIAQWNNRRETFRYETDGMVVKVNSLKMQEQCGSTAHHPRWAMAYKFAARQASSKLLKVEYQVGRTGAVTPVAKIEPVALSGVTISSISLHNEDFIREKDIRLGDRVLVERAGEVIPYIVGIVEGTRDGSERGIVFPKNCPSCGTKLIKPDDEAVWRCDNAECGAQAEERIIHFVSKEAMDIDGLGRSIVSDFVQRGFLKNPADVYQLPFETIGELEGWGERSVEKLKAGIEASKQQPLWRLITGLGIRHVGVGTAKDLSAHIQSVFDLEKKSVESLTNIEGIGPRVAQSIFDFFQNSGNRHLLLRLKDAGVNTDNRPEDSAAKTNKLQGKTFLFTGTLRAFTRDRAKQLVEENGGRLLSSVSANLNYLVAGEEAGSKLSKARKIPSISIITEEEFLQLIA